MNVLHDALSARAREESLAFVFGHDAAQTLHYPSPFKKYFEYLPGLFDPEFLSAYKDRGGKWPIDELDNEKVSAYIFGHYHVSDEMVFKKVLHVTTRDLRSGVFRICAVDNKGLTTRSVIIKKDEQKQFPIILVTSPVTKYYSEKLNPYYTPVPKTENAVIRALVFDTEDELGNLTVLYRVYRQDLFGSFLLVSHGILEKIGRNLWETRRWNTEHLVDGEYFITVEAVDSRNWDKHTIVAEIERSSFTCVKDRDKDGIPDYLEDNNLDNIYDESNETSPVDSDSDDDGLIDGNPSGLEELNNNGVAEPWETDPKNPDTDGDGIYDGTEKGLTQPETDDTDIGAGFFVADEDPSMTTDPTDADSDHDGIIDGNEDKNHDGYIDVSAGETDPSNPDTDGDGIYDGTEIGLTEPQNPDATDQSAGHFVPDADPSSVTDPTKADTDGDGVSDGEEDIKNGAVELD